MLEVIAVVCCQVCADSTSNALIWVYFKGICYSHREATSETKADKQSFLLCLEPLLLVAVHRPVNSCSGFVEFFMPWSDNNATLHLFIVFKRGKQTTSLWWARKWFAEASSEHELCMTPEMWYKITQTRETDGVQHEAGLPLSETRLSSKFRRVHILISLPSFIKT